MEITNKLIYRKSKVINNEKIDVTIRLDENCKNGYEYFSATCSGYYKEKNKWYESFGGCAHDEIIRFFPELKIFTDVHLWSFGGYQTCAVANGFYFIKNGFDKYPIDSDKFTDYFCNYFSCSINQFNELKDSENKFEFAVLLVELGVVDGWKNKVKEAIRQLEKLTGKKFKSKYDKDKNEIIIDQSKLREFRDLKKEGYYSVENKQKRELQRIRSFKAQSVVKIHEDYLKQVNKHKKELEIKEAFLDFGFEVSYRTGNMNGAIYYTHTNELNFNWSTEKIKEYRILDFIKFLDPIKFKGLKVSNDKKTITTI